MYIWTPDAGILISYRDDGNGFSGTVVVEGDPALAEEDPITGEPIPPPAPNQFEVSGLNDSLTFSYTGNAWTVESTKEAAAGLFPVRITYLQTRFKDSMATVSTWNDLPPDSEEIIKLETLASSPFITSFDVTASVDGDPETEETKTYSVEVIHVYTANRDILKLEVDNRR